MIGKLVPVVAPRREMLGQDLAAGMDGGNEAVRPRPAPQMMGELGNDLCPHLRRHLLVDAVIGDHLGEALGEGHIDQHAGAAPGGVQVLHQELLDGAF